MKSTVLIIDDNKLNREMLKDMLMDDYDILESENGKDGLRQLGRHKKEISVILLDLNMPKMDGRKFLEILNKRKWIENYAVIIISNEDDPNKIGECFDLGAFDYIKRPFDFRIIKKRVDNVHKLQQKRNVLYNAFLDQFRERQKELNLIITLLSTVLGYNSNESKNHILNVSIITHILLRKLKEQTNTYKDLTEAEIKNITIAAAFHDIGKLTVDIRILSKPGKLTLEEFTQMSIHTIAGAIMLSDPDLNQDEPIIKYARNICKSHHERWDGQGYPEGLVGNRVPYYAQIVGIADAYDALLHDTCYRKAFDKETAFKMILNDECGKFNPTILKVFKSAKSDINRALTRNKDIDELSIQYFERFASALLNKK